MNNFLVSGLAFLAVYLLSLTLRKRESNRHFEEESFSADRSPIYACWHGRLFYFPYIYRFRERFALLVSPSEDGEILDGIVRRFGFRTVRGSSYQRGTRALRELVRLGREGYSIGMIADGSRGPNRKAQMGSVQLAKLTGAPILPISLSFQWKKEFSSWDRFQLPLPFSKVFVFYGNPVRVPAEADGNTLEEKRRELEDRLNEVTAEADRCRV